MDLNKQGDFFGDYDNRDSALNVNDGVKQPPIINPYLNIKKKPAIKSVDEYMDGILFTSIYHWLAVVAILFAAVECRIFYLSAIDKKEITE